MKKLAALALFLLLLSMISGCSAIRKENPLKLKCPSCGYIWDLTPAEDY